MCPLAGPEKLALSVAVPSGSAACLRRSSSSTAVRSTRLECALLDGEIDIAVHSAKDVPGELAEGTAIAAIPPRAGAFDALCGFADFASIAPGTRVGTSSIRRT